LTVLMGTFLVNLLDFLIFSLMDFKGLEWHVFWEILWVFFFKVDGSFYGMLLNKWIKFYWWSLWVSLMLICWD
jgi:hypothetical protein